MQPRRIVIADADAATRDGIERALIAAGYDAVSAATVPDAFKAIMDTMPHLVLIDVSLDSMDGYTLLAEKQAEPLLAKIPVFLLSNKGTAINMRRVPAGSVIQFIMTLQGDAEEIVSRINTFFGPDEQSVQDNNALDDKGPLKKVLWIENDRLIGNILGKKLVASGFDVIRATDADSAFGALERTVPDVIILDLLPGMNGLDFLEKMRRDIRFRDTPVMIFTNVSDEAQKQRARSLGVEKFITKTTVSFDQVVEEVANLATVSIKRS